jgi:hypothetical protein
MNALKESKIKGLMKMGELHPRKEKRQACVTFLERDSKKKRKRKKRKRKGKKKERRRRRLQGYFLTLLSWAIV